MDHQDRRGNERDGDIALVGGHIRTLDPDATIVEAILIEAGRVVLAGTSDEVRARLRPGTPVIELAGRTVTPGMIDAHTHVELSVLADRLWVDVRDIPVPEMLDRIRAAVAGQPANEWVVAQGTFGQQLPTRAQLDEVAPRNPVVVRESMHQQMANSAALAAAGVNRHYAPRVGIRVHRGAGGEPTGYVEEGFDLFPVPYPPTDWLVPAFREHMLEHFVRHGVTTVHELPATAAAMRAWQRLDADGGMPCRMILNPILSPGHQATVHSVGEFVRGFTTGFGSEWLRLGALKLFLDGVGEAALHRDQLSRSPAGWGLAGFSYNELVDVLAQCRGAGAQVWMHAIGDLAQELAIDAIEEVNRMYGASDHRTRIEHVGNADSDTTQFERLVAAGILPVPTAAFMHFTPSPDGAVAADAPRRHFPYRTLLGHGLCAPGNSDTAGTQPFATNPWHGVSCMVARRNKHGVAIPPPEEAIDVPTAVATYTHNGAYAGFEERSKGSLEPGKLGDLAVYSRDPFSMSPDELPSLEADLTVIGGVVVHDAGRG